MGNPRHDRMARFPRRPRKGDADALKLRSRRGEIGQTWWARQLVGLVPTESPAEAARAAQARSLAVNGRVLSLDLATGAVRARVRNSDGRILHTTLRMTTLSGEAWSKVIAFMAGKAHFAARLLAGELPPDIEQAFSESGVDLLPAGLSTLAFTCSCGAAMPCEHAVAVLYLTAERLDTQPFDLFLLRGRSKQAILDALRKLRGSRGLSRNGGDAPPTWGLDQPPPAGAELPADPATFWGRPPPAVSVAGEARWVVPLSVLQRLGLPTFAPAPRALWYDLAHGYPSAGQAHPDV